MEPEAQNMIDRIFKGAQESAESIVDQARKSAEIILERQRELARQKAMEEVHSMLKIHENRIKSIRETVFAEARRKADWMILSEKNNAIASVLEKVEKKLESFAQSKEYVPILEGLIVNAGVALGGGKLQVQLNERDSSLPLSLNTLAKTITEKTGTKTQLEISKEKIEAVGGAIVKRIDGKILVDNTFEAIIKRSEKNLRLKIAEILFK
ncbi:hypothetical protein HXY33_04460 [Candidatus Bathyarchaeota archaeon]|nr:hypothetical protein [Candidatus Bathyarchaeota archaeon]